MKITVKVYEDITHQDFISIISNIELGKFIRI
jgi:hypothetical protein